MRQHTTQKTSPPCPLAFSLHTAYLSIHWPYFHLPILRRKVAKLGLCRRLATVCRKSSKKAPSKHPDSTVFLTARPGSGKRADFIDDRFIFWISACSYDFAVKFFGDTPAGDIFYCYGVKEALLRESFRRPFSNRFNGFCSVPVTMSCFLEPDAKLWGWLIRLIQSGNA